MKLVFLLKLACSRDERDNKSPLEAHNYQSPHHAVPEPGQSGWTLITMMTAITWTWGTRDAPDCVELR